MFPIFHSQNCWVNPTTTPVSSNHQNHWEAARPAVTTPRYWGRLTFAVANRCIEPESPRLVPSTTFQLQHMDGSYCQSLSLLSFLDVATISRMRHRPQGHATRQVVVNHHMTGWSLGSFHFQYLEACISFTIATLAHAAAAIGNYSCFKEPFTVFSPSHQAPHSSRSSSTSQRGQGFNSRKNIWPSFADPHSGLVH